MIKNVEKENLDLLNESFIDFNSIKNEFKNNPFAKIMVLIENEIIGYIYYSDIYERLEINQFEIREDLRGKGNGKKLLNYMINLEKKDITLEVKKDNYSAIKVYKDSGFVEKAIRKGYYNGIDGILMERKYID